MKIAEGLQEFLSEHVGRGSRPKTLRFYGNTLRNVLNSYLELELSELNVFIVNKAMQSMAERNVKPATLASADRAIRAFTSWLCGVGLIHTDPMKGRKRPKQWQEDKKILSTEEIQSLFNVVKSDRRLKERNTAILYLLLSTGLRAGELCNLTMADIDWNYGILTVRGKTGQGTVPVDRRTLQILRRYTTHGRKATIPQVFVYCNKPMTPDALGRLINRIGQRAGIERPIGPHLFRHTFATLFLERGGNVFELKRLLRHTTLYTSLRYVHSSTEAIRGRLESSDIMRGIQV